MFEYRPGRPAKKIWLRSYIREHCVSAVPCGEIAEAHPRRRELVEEDVRLVEMGERREVRAPLHEILHELLYDAGDIASFRRVYEESPARIRP